MYVRNILNYLQTLSSSNIGLQSLRFAVILLRFFQNTFHLFEEIPFSPTFCYYFSLSGDGYSLGMLQRFINNSFKKFSTPHYITYKIFLNAYELLKL